MMIRKLLFALAGFISLNAKPVSSVTLIKRIFCCFSPAIFTDTVECNELQYPELLFDFPKSPFYAYNAQIAKGQSQTSFYLLNYLLQEGKLDLPGNYFKNYGVSVKFNPSRSGAIFEGLQVFIAMICAITKTKVSDRIAWIGEIGLDGLIYAHKPYFVQKVRAALGIYEKVVIPKLALEYLPEGLKPRVVVAHDLHDLVQYFDRNPFKGDDLSLHVGRSIGVSTSMPPGGEGLVHILQAIVLKDSPDVYINHFQNGANIIPDLRKAIPYFRPDYRIEGGLILRWDRPILGPSWGLAFLVAFFMFIDKMSDVRLIPITGFMPQEGRNMALTGLGDKAKGIVAYGLNSMIFPEGSPEMSQVDATGINKIFVLQDFTSIHSSEELPYLSRESYEKYYSNGIGTWNSISSISNLMLWLFHRSHDKNVKTKYECSLGQAYQAACASSLTHFVDQLSLPIKILYCAYMVCWYPTIFLLEYTLGWFVKDLENKIVVGILSFWNSNFSRRLESWGFKICITLTSIISYIILKPIYLILCSLLDLIQWCGFCHDCRIWDFANFPNKVWTNALRILNTIHNDIVPIVLDLLS